MTIHIIITMLLLLVFLIGSIWFAKKKYQINLAVLGLGAVAFFVSSQILEKLVHILILHPQKDGSIALLQDHPLVYIIYGLAMQHFLRKWLVLFSSNAWRKREVWKRQTPWSMDWGMVAWS
ncbi:Predicted membrane protein [Streptococcus pneumoniae]|nr:Predicted membrane protein [Streptococcus pneumoniae]